MSFESHTGIERRHPFSVIDDLDKGFSYIFQYDLYVISPCVDRIFHQFFHHGCRSLYYFPGSNLIRYGIRQ